jgi:ATP-dependent Clp protease ATP-binding subunit ClpC
LLDEVAYGISSGQHLTVLSVNAVFGQKTGIPFQTIDSDAKQKLASIEDLIHESLVNQHTAVSLLGKALRARTMGVKDDRRPVGSFLFLGPTGVGKTETAKVLSRVYYGSESYITRFDMAEYASSEGYERLIGSSTRGIPGTLAVAIRNKPASLLLLDEIEKATPDIYNIFLTLLDEGYLVDALGKKINCQHLFLVATSNAGAEYIREIVSQGVTGEELQQKVLDHVLKERYFAPEFLNRFDAVVVYEPLTQDHLVSIADKMLSHLSQTLLSRNIHLTWSPETAKKLASDGYTPAFGARAMRRVVDMEIGDLLSRSFLSGDLVDGSVAELLPGEGKHTYILSVKS